MIPECSHCPKKNMEKIWEIMGMGEKIWEKYGSLKKNMGEIWELLKIH